ncbi:MAG: alpha/beta hydrolase fold domain-containing protein [Candidatus Binataceae bacterium]
MAYAQTPDFAARQAAVGAANSKPGPRTVPAKVIPVPSDLDAATAALVAAPYSQFWNLNAPDDAGWRAIVKQFGDAALPELAKGRTALGVTIQPATVGGVKAFILTPKEIPETHKNQLVFNLHGGGYIFGHGESGTGEAMLMAAFGGYKVLAIDYRMPPDAPYPAGMDDATAAWRALAATMDPRCIAVEGTSAGAGMTLSLMLRAKAEGLPLPGAIAPGSPPADLTNTGDSRKTNERIDSVIVSIDAPYPKSVAQLYAHGHDLKDPQLSPIYGDFHGLPPAILATGTRDLFLSITVRTHRKLRRAGVAADLQVYEGLSHAQYLFDPTLTVPKEVFGEIARFFDAHLAR